MSAAAIRYSTRWRLLRARDDPQRAGAVLDAPGRIRRRPEAGDQPRVGIHRAGDHRQQLRHQRLLPADEPAHGVGDVMCGAFASWNTGLPSLRSASSEDGRTGPASRATTSP